MTFALRGLGVLVLGTIQRSAKVDAPGCVNAAGKQGRSDKLEQKQNSPNLEHRL